MRTKGKIVEKQSKRKSIPLVVKCKKTVYMRDSNDIYFHKGVKYKYIREIKTKSKELKGMVLMSEFGNEFVARYSTFGKEYFGKPKKAK